MEEMCKVNVGGIEKEYLEGTSIADIAKDFQSQYDGQIVICKKNGKLTELLKKISSNCELELLTTKSTLGHEVYKRSATLIMLKAFYDVLGTKDIKRIYVRYSLSRGYYCTFEAKTPLTQELLDRVKVQMKKSVDEDITINKRNIPALSAVELFARHKMYDKERLFKFRRASRVNIYNLKGFEDYFYGYMVPSTGYIKHFDLKLYDSGFVLQLPTRKEPEKIPEFDPQPNLFKVLKESEAWGDMMGVDTVGALNEKIALGKSQNLILVSEALMEKKIGDIAQKIASNTEKKIILVAGPSSSGKTTFSHRLGIQLRACGYTPHTISVDNYFIDRIHTPRDENGNYNFETIKAIDVELLNKDMLSLIAGEEVSLPTYNFITGKREFNGNYIKLGNNDVLIIEGIHGLNEELTYKLPKKNKYKIYISALTQLNIDEHNRISTTDGRLIRRIVRDARTRGISAEETLMRWGSVRHGEESYIFPFQEGADIMFNSALIYELAVLKIYAEPLLFGIQKDSPVYVEAKRLLKFLDYFLAIDTTGIPNNSLVREFIGGGCFDL